LHVLSLSRGYGAVHEAAYTAYVSGERLTVVLTAATTNSDDKDERSKWLMKQGCVTRMDERKAKKSGGLLA
jgi:hypothetical protein